MFKYAMVVVAVLFSAGCATDESPADTLPSPTNELQAKIETHTPVISTSTSTPVATATPIPTTAPTATVTSTAAAVPEVAPEATGGSVQESEVIQEKPTPTTTASPKPAPTPSETGVCEQYIKDIRDYVDLMAEDYDVLAEIADKLEKGELSSSTAESSNRFFLNEIRRHSAYWNLHRREYTPPENVKPLQLLLTRFSFANIKLVDAVFNGEGETAIRDRSRAMVEIRQLLNMVLANPPACR